jgi:hypothetical protein
MFHVLEKKTLYTGVRRAHSSCAPNSIGNAVLISNHSPPMASFALVFPEHGYGEEGAITNVAGARLVVF